MRIGCSLWPDHILKSVSSSTFKLMQVVTEFSTQLLTNIEQTRGMVDHFRHPV